MNTDPLRDRIARTDPALGDADISPVTSDSSQHLLEAIMNTPLDTTTPTPAPNTGPTRTPRRWQWALGAAAVAALAVGGAALGGAFDSDDGEITTADQPDKLTVLELSTGDVDPMMMSCIRPSPEILAEVPIAFQATVTMVDAELVTMLVDQWYVGGDAGQVTLTAPSGMEALIGGLDFQVGTQYLVSASNGVVNYCGLTGEATPELQELFDAAFPG